MNNKIILELVAKSLEEINLLVEALRNGEKADPLLIEITTSKAKILYQELMLLSSNEPVIVQKDQLIASEEISVSEDKIVDASLPEPLIEPEKIVAVAEEIEDVTSMESANVLEEISVPDEVFKDVITSEPAVEDNTPLPSETEIPETQIVETETEINHSESVEETKLVEEVKTEEVSDLYQPEDEIVAIDHNETEVVQNSEPVIVEIKETPTVEVQEIKVFGEQFVNEPSIYEKLSAATNFESKIKGKPIINIMNSIGINDRFLFSRELFANDNKNFETTVNQLDSLNNFLEAIEYLENNFKWTKNEASLKFMDLVKRRFEN